MRVSETLINKKIIYSTKHITEMAITKTKTMEKIITDLLLSMKESNKDIIETQDKTDPIM